MDFLKTLLAYMGATLVIAVESTSTPSVTPVPTPAPMTPAPASAVEILTEAPAAEVTATPTVSVTPAPVPTITPNLKGYHNLLVGDKGEEVKKLQERLIELGYLPEGSADGAFGGKTRNAVRLFQYYNSLTVDGIAGRATQTNLFENPDAAPKPTEEPTPEPTETPTAVPTETPAPEMEQPEARPTAEQSEEPEEERTDEAPAAERMEAPAGTPSPAEEPTAEPTVTPYVVAPATEIPWGDEVASTEEPGEKPDELTPADAAEEPEKPETEAAEQPDRAEETEKPESPALAENTDQVLPMEEIEEHVNLDEEEAEAEPTSVPEETPIPWEDLAGWILLNEGEEALQWTAEEDGAQVVRSPRMQRQGEDIRLSLDDLARCLEGWALHEEENALILEAWGNTLALLEEAEGPVATVNGQELAADRSDFSLEEGRFIRAEFLTRALEGTWEWDAEEETLRLWIPEKEEK